MHTIQAGTLRRQLTEVYRAWGVPDENITVIVENMVESDLRGIDSHGVGMLPRYDGQRKDGALNMTPDVRVVRDFGAVALIDADHLVELLQPVDGSVAAGARGAALQLACECWVEDVVDEGRLACAGHARDRGEDAQRELGVDVVEVVLGRALDRETAGGRPAFFSSKAGGGRPAARG